MGFFERFRAKKRLADQAAELYVAAVQQSRMPRFYVDLGVPDTVDGRFDMIVLHVMLLIRRLRGEGQDAAMFSQELLNLLFADMDRNFREMGIGDMSIGKHVKKVAKAFYGRAEVLENGLDAGHEALVSSLTETLFRSVEEGGDAPALASYVIETDQVLANQPLQHIMDGQTEFTADVKTTVAAS